MARALAAAIRSLGARTSKRRTCLGLSTRALALHLSRSVASFSSIKQDDEQIRRQAWSQVRSPHAAEAERNDLLPSDENLRRIYRAMGMQDYLPDEHITATGKAEIMGMQGDWIIKWCMDGRFYEKYECQELTYEWGHDGKYTWHTDAGGRVSRLDLDEGEVLVLSTWVRTGFWVTKEAQRYLDIQLVPEDSAAVDHTAESELVFAIRLKQKKMLAHIVVNKERSLPEWMVFQGFCFRDIRNFSNWQSILQNRGCRLPTNTSHVSVSVGQDIFTMLNVEVDPVEDFAKNGSVYSYPLSSLVPRYNRRYPRVHIDSSCRPSVQMTKTIRGHYVVRPRINGEDIGFFIVDTGTGGLAITRKKARELGLSTFGEIYATGMSGGNTMKTQFSRGTSFQVGPLTITDPMFMEVGIDRLLKDASGLIGFDMFYGPIVEMSHVDRTLSLYDPVEYEALPRARELDWQKMYLFDNVPHVYAKVNKQLVLLMFDTGAAGAQLMFPNSVLEGHGRKEADTTRRLRGKKINVSQAEWGNVANFEIAGHIFKDVPAIIPHKSAQKLCLSRYCAGYLGADMVNHFVLVFDYANRRMAFLDRRSRR